VSLADPDAYELQGVVEGKDENGEWYSNREFVLSYDSDDAGDIDMRISKAEPLFTSSTILEHIARLRDEAMDENKSDSVIGAYNKLEEVFQNE